MEIVLKGKCKRWGTSNKGNYLKLSVPRKDSQEDDVVITKVSSLDGITFGKEVSVRMDAFVQFGKFVSFEK